MHTSFGPDIVMVICSFYGKPSENSSLHLLDSIDREVVALHKRSLRP